ncbi:hypothetical protein AM228_26865 [Planktothricoides sp. SR001]|nr:hypothetical protein AM228_26865 [Planktothricoides sp. SR001]
MEKDGIFRKNSDSESLLKRAGGIGRIFKLRHGLAPPELCRNRVFRRCWVAEIEIRVRPREDGG